MADLRVVNFISKLNENLEFLLRFNSIDFDLNDVKDCNEETFKEAYSDLIDELLSKNPNEWLEKHLILHYFEFVDRFSKSFLDKKLLLLVALSMSTSYETKREYNRILINTIKSLLNNITWFMHEDNNEIPQCKKMFHLSFCYFLRICLCKLSRHDVMFLADKMIQVVLEECRLVTNQFSYESAEVVGDIIKKLDNEVSYKYVGQFMNYLFQGLTYSIPVEDDFNKKISFFVCIRYFNDFIVKFKSDLNQYMPELIRLISLFYEELKREQDGYSLYLILELFNACVEEIDEQFSKNWIHSVLFIFDEIAFNKSIYIALSEACFIKSECLRFYSKLTHIDISLVYKRKNKLIELLNEVGRECLLNEIDDSRLEDVEYYGDDFEDVLFYSLAFIEDLIKYWNFEIFILLDTIEIQNLFRRSRESYDPEVQSLAETVMKFIEDNNSNLVRFNILNGYSKLLN